MDSSFNKPGWVLVMWCVTCDAPAQAEDVRFVDHYDVRTDEQMTIASLLLTDVDIAQMHDGHDYELRYVRIPVQSESR